MKLFKKWVYTTVLILKERKALIFTERGTRSPTNLEVCSVLWVYTTVLSIKRKSIEIYEQRGERLQRIYKIIQKVITYNN